MYREVFPNISCKEQLYNVWQILRLFEEPDYWLEIQRKREELIDGISLKSGSGLFKLDDSDTAGPLFTK